jgi:heme-degrading monooxygenase HmoA
MGSSLTEEGQMHAVVVKVTINDETEADRQVREDVVPRVSQAPGFVTGYWTRKDSTGLSMVVFESEDAATAFSERVPSIAADAVTVESVEVREVAAHA